MSKIIKCNEKISSSTCKVIGEKKTFQNDLPAKPEYSALYASKKISAIFVDLDNTLWNGTLAEMQNIALNSRLLDFLKSAEKKGINLFVVSRNDKDDVDDAFNRLGIDASVFTFIIANWDAKYLSIERLIENTGIPAERVVFLDDSPMERNETKLRIPAINCVDAKDWEILKSVQCISTLPAQERSEIFVRKNRYTTAIQTQSLMEETGGKEDPAFFKELRMEVKIGRISADMIGSGSSLDRFTRLL